VIETVILALGALAVVFWFGLAYWVTNDARRRIRNRFWIAVATALGLVPLVGPAAYVLFRPAETREDVRARNAEMAAFETYLVERPAACPTCSALVEDNFRVCPVCATRLREACTQCDAPLQPLWQICPYCATPVEAEVDLDVALTREAGSGSAATLDLVAGSSEV
jgi:RNA polymerase subunit RPABC4/transcription elongation factor Spt4